MATIWWRLDGCTPEQTTKVSPHQRALICQTAPPRPMNNRQGMEVRTPKKGFYTQGEKAQFPAKYKGWGNGLLKRRTNATIKIFNQIFHCPPPKLQSPPKDAIFFFRQNKLGGLIIFCSRLIHRPWGSAGRPEYAQGSHRPTLGAIPG